MDKRTFATRREALEAGPLFPRGGRWIEGVVEYWAEPPSVTPNYFKNQTFNFKWVHYVYGFPLPGYSWEDAYEQILKTRAPDLSADSTIPIEGIMMGYFEEPKLAAKLNPDLTGMEPALSKGGGK